MAIAGWASLVIAGLVFLAIAWNVNAHAALVTLDAKVATWLHGQATPVATAFFMGVTMMNSILGVTVMSLVFAAVLARMREWYWMLTLALAVAGGMLLNVALKDVYERARPHFDDPFVTLSTYSFPSGHTAGSVVLYGVLAAFLVSRFRDWPRRTACVTGAIVMVLLVAFSRMYLGAHYLSDVVAAICSSTAWLSLCLSAVHALVRRRMRESRA